MLDNKLKRMQVLSGLNEQVQQPEVQQTQPVQNQPVQNQNITQTTMKKQAYNQYKDIRKTSGGATLLSALKNQNINTAIQTVRQNPALIEQLIQFYQSVGSQAGLAQLQ